MLPPLVTCTLSFHEAFGGTLLSHALHNLRALGTHLSFHDNCGALELAANGFVQKHLTGTRTHGYKFLQRIGYNAPTTIRTTDTGCAGVTSCSSQLERIVNLLNKK